MISVHSMKRTMIGGQPYDFEFKGLSTDTKPSTWGGNDVGVNSLFFEQDTGDFYYLKQQGSSSTTKEDILEETTFEANEPNNNGYNYTTYVYVNSENIKVDFDGTTYTCTQDQSGRWGAPQNGEYQFDFSEYPFSIYSYYSSYPVCIITVADENEHAISIYKEETVVTETVWEKIGGSGSDDPLLEIDIDEWTSSSASYSYYEYVTDVDLPDSITVDWNGTPYQCTNGSQEESYKVYGAPWDDMIEGYDFSEYPFRISYSVDSESDNIVYYIYAESSDTPVTVKIYG